MFTFPNWYLFLFRNALVVVTMAIIAKCITPDISVCQANRLEFVKNNLALSRNVFN